MRRLLVVSLTVIGLVTAFAAAAQATDVALFFNPTFVDTTSPSPDADAQNFKQALEIDGFTVTTFTGITAADISAAVAGKQVLAFPELEVRDLSPVLDANALFAIASFVSTQGGTLIMVDQADGDPLAIINKAFNGGDFHMTAAVSVTGPITLTPAADGTPFAGGPATLPLNNATAAVLASSLPPSAKIIYADANGNGVVVLIPPTGGVTGGGNIIILGWDWFNSVSAGGTEDDTAWNAVLKIAGSITGTAAIPTLSEWALIAMATVLVLFGLRGLRRRVAA